MEPSYTRDPMAIPQLDGKISSPTDLTALAFESIKRSILAGEMDPSSSPHKK
jgi:hypothetical protein